MLRASENLIIAVFNSFPLGTHDGNFFCQDPKGDWLLIPKEGLDECEQAGYVEIQEDCVALTESGLYWAKRIIKGRIREARKQTRG